MALKAKHGKREITINEILFFAPRVGSVIKRAKFSKARDWRAYERFKAEISIDVGWFAKVPALRSSHCYELAIAALVGAMGRLPKQRGQTK